MAAMIDLALLSLAFVLFWAAVRLARFFARLAEEPR